MGDGFGGGNDVVGETEEVNLRNIGKMSQVVICQHVVLKLQA